MSNIRTGTPLKLLSVNWDSPKISKCGEKLKYRTKRNMFVFRVQQTAMVCEHTMEQQSFLVQSMPSGVNTKHSLLKLVCRFVTHGISFQSLWVPKLQWWSTPWIRESFWLREDWRKPPLPWFSRNTPTSGNLNVFSIPRHFRGVPVRIL